MRKSSSAVAILTVALWGTSVARAGNLVTNGGFETGDFTGWTLSGNMANPGTDWGVDNTDPHSGTYEAFFGAVGSPIFLKQTLATTVGQTYTINFWLDQTVDPNGPYHNYFTASFEGTTIDALSNIVAQPYTEYTFTEKATSASSVLQFSFQNGAGFFDIDDISVSPKSSTIPEPSSLILIAPGLAALYFLRKRRS